MTALAAIRWAYRDCLDIRRYFHSQEAQIVILETVLRALHVYTHTTHLHTGRHIIYVLTCNFLPCLSVTVAECLKNSF